MNKLIKYTQYFNKFESMKHLFIYLITVIILISCQADTGKYKDVKNLNNTEEIKNNETVDLSISHFTNKVFEFGSSTHFTDECDFYFECDCCSGDLIFNSDSTFYAIDYCMSDQSISEGNYAIRDNMLILKYSGVCVSEKYNWENEMDTSAIDYFIKDTINAPLNIEFYAQFCNDKLKLVYENESKKSFVIESKKPYKESINHLSSKGFIQRIKSLKTNIQNVHNTIKNISVNEPTIIIFEFDSAEIEKVKQIDGEDNFYTAMDDLMLYNAQLLEKADSLKIPVIYEQNNTINLEHNKTSYLISKDSLESVYTYIHFDGNQFKVKDLFQLLDEIK